MVTEWESLVGGAYSELREIAAYLMRNERPNHTLEASALVNETFLRLSRASAPGTTESCALIAFAARTMRQVLVDHARKRKTKKRGADLDPGPFADLVGRALLTPEVMFDLNCALERLAALDPRAVSIIELKFFAGCTNKETAKVLGVSDATVESDWLHARMWLYRELEKTPAIVNGIDQ